MKFEIEKVSNGFILVVNGEKYVHYSATSVGIQVADMIGAPLVGRLASPLKVGQEVKLKNGSVTMVQKSMSKEEHHPVILGNYYDPVSGLCISDTEEREHLAVIEIITDVE